MKIAIVTGATKGIGLATARELCGRGYMVYGTYASEYAAEVLAELESERFCLCRADVNDGAAAQALVDRVLEEHGRLDVLVSNAGITRDTLLPRMSEEDFEQVLAVNLTGAFRVSKAAIRPMIKQRGGRVIFISSVVGISGNAGQANYAAAKAGLIGFAKSMAKELAGRNITVNCVAPGVIRTDMTNALKDETKDAILKGIPLKRFGEAEDVAKTVAFLASEDAGYITGEVMNISGGLLI